MGKHAVPCEIVVEATDLDEAEARVKLVLGENVSAGWFYSAKVIGKKK